MDQKPIYDSSFISGVIMNDANYAPVNEEPPNMPLETELCTDDKEKECKSVCTCRDKIEEVTLAACDEFKEFVIPNVHMHCQGRLLTVKVQLKDVCPGRKIRLAVLLFENDCHKRELSGLRTAEIKVPFSPCGCVDEMTVGDFCFVVPEDTLCARKEVTVEVVAHYASFPTDCRQGG